MRIIIACMVALTLIGIGWDIGAFNQARINQELKAKEMVPPLSLRFPPRMRSYALGDSLWVVGRDGEGFLIPHGSFLCVPDTTWDHTPRLPS